MHEWHKSPEAKLLKRLLGWHVLCGFHNVQSKPRGPISKTNVPLAWSRLNIKRTPPPLLCVDPLLAFGNFVLVGMFRVIHGEGATFGFPHCKVLLAAGKVGSSCCCCCSLCKLFLKPTGGWTQITSRKSITRWRFGGREGRHPTPFDFRDGVTNYTPERFSDTQH